MHFVLDKRAYLISRFSAAASSVRRWTTGSICSFAFSFKRSMASGVNIRPSGVSVPARSSTRPPIKSRIFASNAGASTASADSFFDKIDKAAEGLVVDDI